MSRDRTAAIVIVAVVGAALGSVGGAAFNLAGLIWAGSSFETALYWDPLESGITVFFGCAMLLGWVGTIAAILVVSRVGVNREDAVRVKRVGYIAAGISFAIVVFGLVFSLAVLPAQYEWVKY